MRLGILILEAWASVRGARMASALVLIATAAMCAIALLTAGSSAAQRESIREQLGTESARTLTVTIDDERGAINETTIAQIGSLSTTEAVIARALPTDATNPTLKGGTGVMPLWTVQGDLPGAVQLTAGRWPGPGEAIIADAAAPTFGLSAHVGAATTADGASYPIVGRFHARDAFDDLNSGILVSPTPGQSPEMFTVNVLGHSLDQAALLQRDTLGILAPPDPKTVRITSPVAGADTARELDARLAASARTQLFTILGAGLLFVGSVVLADVLIRARDLGRRRTLGISRLDLVLLVMVRTAIAAIAGAVVGCAAATIAAGSSAPSLMTSVFITILGVSVAIFASVPPSMYAATRDPVRVLRTP